MCSISRGAAFCKYNCVYNAIISDLAYVTRHRDGKLEILVKLVIEIKIEQYKYCCREQFKKRPFNYH